jgi:hypothetical protein
VTDMPPKHLESACGETAAGGTSPGKSTWPDRADGEGREEKPDNGLVRERMAETVRLVVTRRERAPRSPRMERALKRLLLRYARQSRELRERSKDAQE